MFILDSGKHCFVWIGRGASHDEKKNGLSRAHVSGCCSHSLNLKRISIPYCTVSARTPMVINITFSLDGMRVGVIGYKPHTLSLRPFNLIASFIFTAAKLFHQVISSYEKERSIKLRIDTGG